MTIDADTGGMGASSHRIGIFGDAIGSTGFSLCDLEFSNHAYEPLRPPDVAGCGIDGNQVRSEATGRVGAYQVLVHHSGCGIFADSGYRRIIFSKPDVIFSIYDDSIGLAIGRRGSKLFEDVRSGSEASDFFGVVLGKPDEAFVINNHVPGSRPRRGNGPLLEGFVDGIIHTNRVIIRLCEPDVAFGIECQKKSLREIRGQLDSGNPAQSG